MRPYHAVLLLLFFSCSPPGAEPGYEAVKRFLAASHSPRSGSPEIRCSVSDSQWQVNVPFTFNEAINETIRLFGKADSCSASRETALYLKAMILASLVHSVCPYQFLGHDMGKAEFPDSVSGWALFTLKEMYQHANINRSVVQCGDRSVFFARLCDSLLHLETEIISIPAVHTYPLVRIAGRKYIIDPYYMPLVCDNTNNRIPDYEALRNVPPASLAIEDCRLFFGRPVGLAAKSFYPGSLKDTVLRHETFCEQVHAVVDRVNRMPVSLKGVCRPLDMEDTELRVYPLNNRFYSFAVISDGVFGHTMHNTKSFFYQYFGKECSN